MEELIRFVGIDVAKAALEVFIGSTGAAFSVANDEVGIRELLRQMKPADFVILEATGGLEMPVASALAAAGVAVAIVNPRQVRDFARATGRLAKTDRLDAEVLARFGETVRPTARPLADEQTQALEALVTRRRQLVEILTAEKNRRARAPKILHRSLDEHIKAPCGFRRRTWRVDSRHSAVAGARRAAALRARGWQGARDDAARTVA